MENTSKDLLEMNQAFKEAANELRKTFEPLMRSSFFAGSNSSYKSTIGKAVSQINQCGSINTVNNEMFHYTLKGLADIVKQLGSSNQDKELKHALTNYIAKVQQAAKPYITEPDRWEKFVDAGADISSGPK